MTTLGARGPFLKNTVKSPERFYLLPDYYRVFLGDLCWKKGTKRPVSFYKATATRRTNRGRWGRINHSRATMIEGSFDARTLAYMHIALERVCEHTPLGEQHDVRRRVAEGILRCAKCGRTTLGALIEAGERALIRIPGQPNWHPAAAPTAKQTVLHPPQ
jgi:ribosomal protein L37AE/L43A